MITSLPTPCVPCFAGSQQVPVEQAASVPVIATPVTPPTIVTTPVFEHTPLQTGISYTRSNGETVDMFVQHARLHGTDRSVPGDFVIWIGDLHCDPCKSTCFDLPFEDVYLLWQYLNSFTVAALIGVEPLAMPDWTVPDIEDLDTFDDREQFTLQYRYAQHVGIPEVTTFSMQLHPYTQSNTPLLLLAIYNEQEGRHEHDQLVTLSQEEARVLYDFLAHPAMQSLLTQWYSA